MHTNHPRNIHQREKLKARNVLFPRKPFKATNQLTDQLIIFLCNAKHFLSRAYLLFISITCGNFYRSKKRNRSKSNVSLVTFRLFYYNAGRHQLCICRDMFWCFNQKFDFMKEKKSCELNSFEQLINKARALAIQKVKSWFNWLKVKVPGDWLIWRFDC